MATVGPVSLCFTLQLCTRIFVVVFFLLFLFRTFSKITRKKVQLFCRFHLFPRTMSQKQKQKRNCKKIPRFFLSSIFQFYFFSTSLRMIEMRNLSLKVNKWGSAPIYVCYVSICVFNDKIGVLKNKNDTTHQIKKSFSLKLFLCLSRNCHQWSLSNGD